jgi:hypothetical protein
MGLVSLLRGCAQLLLLLRVSEWALAAALFSKLKQDCVMSEWGHCSVCTGDETGVQLCMRSVLVDPLNGGKACGQVAISRPCESFDCRVGPWHDCSPCSATCGSSEKLCLRSVVAQASLGGRPCPVLQKAISCKALPCADDCIVTTWEAWTQCTLTCKSQPSASQEANHLDTPTGSITRSRNIVVPAVHGGAACPPLSQTKPCNTHPCPQDCAVGPWEPWSYCFASCGGSHQTRQRSILAPSMAGGKNCGSGSFVRSAGGALVNQRAEDTVSILDAKSCETQPCPIDCAFSPSVCSECTKSCGGGTQVRVRLFVCDCLRRIDCQRVIDCRVWLIASV